MARCIMQIEDGREGVDPHGPKIALTPAEVAELDRRLEELRSHPVSAEQWKKVRERIRTLLLRTD